MKHFFTRIIALTVLMLSTGMIMAQTYSYPVKGQQGFSLTEKTRDGMHISYQLGQFTLSQLDYRGEEMSEISINGIVLPNAAGSPNLPTESRMMAIPTGAKATLDVVHYDMEVFHNVNIAPALRIQAETEEPDMDYKKDMKVYARDAFYPENPFEMGETYIRGVDAITVAITPFQYNPVTKELKVFTNIELSVRYEGGNGHFGEDRLRSPYWDPILAAELMNYDQLPVIDYEARMQQWLRDGAEGAEYLIITPNNDAWAPYAQQLKDFRMRQGILTQVYRLDEIPATSTNALKTWFHNAYHNWEIAPVAVCLMGDHGTNMSQYIPAEEVYHSSSYGNCITDNRYADAQGDDNLPDMVFSRLVAQNASELPIFVGKQIEYEYTNPNMDPSFYTSPVTALGWQTERWFQLCSEVFGGYMRNKGYNTNRINCIYQGTPGEIWSSNQNTSMVVNYFGPNGQNYIPASPTELGGWNGGTPAQVVEAVNNGTFWIQHRDHGLNEGWGEPAVRNPHVDQMNNVGKLPFLMSINCETGMFDYTGSNGNCFTEKWMRRTYNGQNAGAVGVLSPTDVSYSFVNDAYVWGVYDLFDGDFMPTYGPFQPAAPQTGNWRPAFGNVAGKYFLAQSSWPYNVESKNITYTMFTAHCDAFLRIYTQVPQTMSVSHQSIQHAGLTTFQVTAPAGTTIALTKGEGEDMEIVAVATATGTLQNIEIPSQVPPTILKLTVTGQDYLRYESDIEVIPASGPYIIINDYALSFSAPQLNYGEDAGLDLVLKNVGSDQAPAGTATLTSESEYVTITNGTVDFEAIAPNSDLDLNEAFAFTISDEVPNKTVIPFTVTITSGDDTYESQIKLKAFAPEFEIGNVAIQEINGNGNNHLDPGETVKLSFPIKNAGNAQSQLVEATLESNNYMVIVGEPTVTIEALDVDATQNVEFTIYVCGTPSNNTAEYTLNAVSGAYTATKQFTSKIGLNVEDFESASLDPSMWTNSTTAPWTFDTQEPYEGTYCLKSGSIGDNSETVITLTYTATENFLFSFYYKVSSENNYDKLFFYIDNVEKNNWSGTINWTQKQYPIAAGTHTFQWKYKKDTSVASGSDCCWIDYIMLPHDETMTANAGIDINTCEDEPAQLLGYASNYETLLWTTDGDGTFNDPTIANAIYLAGPQDIANGNVTLTMTVNGNGNTVTDDIMVSFFHNVSISIPPTMLPIEYCAVEEPQGIAVEVEGDYTSFQWTTTGSGVFENANEMITTYTPSGEDITAGSVTLLATATSAGCGPVEFEYTFEMHPLPVMSMPLPNCILMVSEGQDFVVDFAYFEGFIDGLMTMEINEETISLTEGEPLVLHTSELEPGDYSFTFHNLSNGFCDTDPDLALDIKVLETPNLTVSETTFEICEGETVSVELMATGGDPTLQTYTVEGEGFEPITFTGASYTLEMTPAEFTELHLTRVTAENSGCGNDCEAGLDITISVNVIPYAAVPEISGETELDVRLTPTTTYTIDNDVMVSYTLEPAEAGTMVPANDGKTVVVTWSESYKGDVTLTATPMSECNNGDSNMTITVRNTTSVSEFANNAKVYPNPTSEKVNIECTGMTHVSVFNTLGQMVYNAEVDTDKVTINTENLPAGSYLVRITTAEGSIAKHLTIIK